MGERREEGAYLNQPVVPALRPTCQQPSDSRFLFHSLSQSLSGAAFPSLPPPLYLSVPIYLSASHPLYSFTLLQLRHYKTNKSHLSRCASLSLSDCHFHFTASYWEQLWPLDPGRLFVLATSDVTQNSNKLWRTT